MSLETPHSHTTEKSKHRRNYHSYGQKHRKHRSFDARTVNWDNYYLYGHVSYSTVESPRRFTFSSEGRAGQTTRLGKNSGRDRHSDSSNQTNGRSHYTYSLPSITTNTKEVQKPQDYLQLPPSNSHENIKVDKPSSNPHENVNLKVNKLSSNSHENVNLKVNKPSAQTPTKSNGSKRHKLKKSRSLSHAVVLQPGLRLVYTNIVYIIPTTSSNIMDSDNDCDCDQSSTKSKTKTHRRASADKTTLH